jgi:hypothetical protein
MSWNALLLPLLLATVVVPAPEKPDQPEQPDVAEAVKSAEPAESPAAEPPAKEGPKMVSGMSILGNQEAPKSLVIVPWKGSEIGDSLGISAMLDDSRQPVDREVFMRELGYYEIRSEKKP